MNCLREFVIDVVDRLTGPAVEAIRECGAERDAAVSRVAECEAKLAAIRDRTKVWREEAESALSLDVLDTHYTLEACADDICIILDSQRWGRHETKTFSGSVGRDRHTNPYGVT